MCDFHRTVSVCGLKWIVLRERRVWGAAGDPWNVPLLPHHPLGQDPKNVPIPARSLGKGQSVLPSELVSSRGPEGPLKQFPGCCPI